ncbi:hypothetical protein Sjap_012573 [Stephania japonica]|uniref:Uncharacterized protein n=1 Tax=Stephania japonica TaxID=461633 RepID=A0AAP0IYQ0_9MAGN
MTKQIVLRTASSNRRQPLLEKRAASGGGARFAEAAGEATAECAAVCCCCPCGLVNLIVLAVYKLPAGLCRRAMRKRRMRRKLMMRNQRTSSCNCGACGDDAAETMQSPFTPTDGEFHHVKGDDNDDDDDDDDDEEEEEKAMELEKEMWDRFYSTGFWRSPSQRDTNC